GVWNPISLSFLSSTMACLFRQSYLDWFEHWTEAPPFPSVPLLRYAHCELLTKLRIDHEATPSPRTDEAAKLSDFCGDERFAVFRLEREIRLALGPTSGADSIGPMFESRAYLQLQFPGNLQTTFALHPALTLKPIDDALHAVPPCVFQALLEDGWHRVLPIEPFEP